MKVAERWNLQITGTLTLPRHLKVVYHTANRWRWEKNHRGSGTANQPMATVVSSEVLGTLGNLTGIDCAHSFAILGHVRHLLFRIFEQLWFIDMFVPWTYCNQKCQVLMHSRRGVGVVDHYQRFAVGFTACRAY